MCPTNSAKSICGLEAANYNASRNRLYLCGHAKATIISALFNADLVPQHKSDLTGHGVFLEEVYNRCGLDQLYEPPQLRVAVYEKFLCVVTGLVHKCKKEGATMELPAHHHRRWDSGLGLGTVEAALAWMEQHQLTDSGDKAASGQLSQLAITQGQQDNVRSQDRDMQTAEAAPPPLTPPSRALFPSGFSTVTVPTTPTRSSFPFDPAYNMSPTSQLLVTGVASLGTEILSGALSPRSPMFSGSGSSTRHAGNMVSATSTPTGRGLKTYNADLPDPSSLPSLPLAMRRRVTPITTRLVDQAREEGDAIHRQLRSTPVPTTIGVRSASSGGSSWAAGAIQAALVVTESPTSTTGETFPVQQFASVQGLAQERQAPLYTKSAVVHQSQSIAPTPAEASSEHSSQPTARHAATSLDVLKTYNTMPTSTSTSAPSAPADPFQPTQLHQPSHRLSQPLPQTQRESKPAWAARAQSSPAPSPYYTTDGDKNLFPQSADPPLQPPHRVAAETAAATATTTATATAGPSGAMLNACDTGIDVALSSANQRLADSVRLTAQCRASLDTATSALLRAEEAMRAMAAHVDEIQRSLDTISEYWRLTAGLPG